MSQIKRGRPALNLLLAFSPPVGETPTNLSAGAYQRIRLRRLTGSEPGSILKTQDRIFVTVLNQDKEKKGENND
jgi:hypothetical protein